MKTTTLHGSHNILSEIVVPERAPRAVAIERVDKPAYECRIGEDRFVFRSARSNPRTAPRGPGIELRQTLSSEDPVPIDLEEQPGQPGLVRSLRSGKPLDLHIERMDDSRFWCRIGPHEFSLTRVGERSAGIELVRA